MLFSACAILSALLNFIKFCPPLLPVLLFVSFSSSVSPPTTAPAPLFSYRGVWKAGLRFFKECAGDNHPTAVPIMEPLRWITVRCYGGETRPPESRSNFSSSMQTGFGLNFARMRRPRPSAEPLPGTAIVQKLLSLLLSEAC